MAFAVCLAASVGGAQDAPTFIAGTCYTCDVSTEDKADAIYSVRTVWCPEESSGSRRCR